MAQSAHPQTEGTALPLESERWTAKTPPGNPRVGHGVGGTDRAVVEQPGYFPKTEGESVDTRFRKQGPR